jgi:hypothetical protein
MRSTGAQRILEEKGEITGHFVLRDMDPELAAPGVLRYTPSDGTTLRLIDAPAGWPTSLGHRGDLVVHGTTSEGGQPLTLLDARVSSIALGDRSRRYGGPRSRSAHTSTARQRGRALRTRPRTYTNGWATAGFDTTPLSTIAATPGT